MNQTHETTRFVHGGITLLGSALAGLVAFFAMRALLEWIEWPQKLHLISAISWTFVVASFLATRPTTAWGKATTLLGIAPAIGFSLGAVDAMLFDRGHPPGWAMVFLYTILLCRLLIPALAILLGLAFFRHEGRAFITLQCAYLALLALCTYSLKI